MMPDASFGPVFIITAYHPSLSVVYLVDYKLYRQQLLVNIK